MRICGASLVKIPFLTLLSLTLAGSLYAGSFGTHLAGRVKK